VRRPEHRRFCQTIAAGDGSGSGISVADAKTFFAVAARSWSGNAHCYTWAYPKFWATKQLQCFPP